MAGNAKPNLPSYFIDSTEKRTGEVAAADWDGGMNPGGSCAPGVGINTGDYDPKLSDWPDSNFNGAEAVPYFGESSHIGLDAGANNRINLVDGADVNDQVELVVAAGNTAPGGTLTPGGQLNETGKTVPAGARCWGRVPVA